MRKNTDYNVPILVVVCLLLAIIGYSFSANLASMDDNSINPLVLGATKNISEVDLLSINDNTGTSYYYKGDREDNYIKLNNLMFRIVRYNGDGTIRLILNEDVLVSSYNTVDFNTSDCKKLLLKWLDSNFGDASYIVESDYDVTNYITYETYNLINFDGYMLDRVGLLSVKEASIISDGLDNSYINSKNGMYLGNGYGLYDIWYFKNKKIDVIDYRTKLSLRPVINIKNVELEGKGTKNEPFVIKED